MLKFSAILLGLFVTTLTAVPHHKLPLVAHRNLMDFMVKSRTASQENPARSLSCFDYYVPVLNGITEEYEKNYGACMLAAQDGFDKIDGQTQPERNQIESDAKAACYALANCADYENSIDYFSCFNVEGSYNSKTMYNISANSAEILIGVREQYRLIETEQYRCTNNSERVYVENTASTYEELQSCLQGKSPVPTPTEPTEPTTVVPPLTEPTTRPTPEDTTTELPTTASPTTERSTPGDGTTTTEAVENENDADKDVVENRKSRMLQDSKWRHILGKLGSHIH